MKAILQRAKRKSADRLAQQYPQQTPEARRSLRPVSSTAKHRPHGVTFDTAPNGPHSAQPSISSESFAERISQGADSQFERHSFNHSEIIPPSSPDFSDFDEDRGEAVSVRSAQYSSYDGPTVPRSRQTYQPRRAPAVHKSMDSMNSVSFAETPDTVADRIYTGPGDRSSAASTLSQETAATSVQTLPALQTKGPDNSDAQHLEPVLEDDPRSWDLVPPAEENGVTGIYALEQRAEQLLSSEHLQMIFDDPKLLLKFTGFLNSHRPSSIPILIYYLDALKALRAINYANAIAEALAPLKGHGFTQEVPEPTINAQLEEKADRAFEILVREDLPAYIAHVWIQVVSVSIQRRITGTLAPHLREASEGLAEVFCLTDPSRPDNPIVFASEEFARTTQYGMNYSIGRNCRFLQGPRTNQDTVRRLADAVELGKEHTEVLVNYRRDGTPFLNLLMMAPLMDSRGKVRYYIGAQADVSGLLKECSDIEGLTRLVEKEEREDRGEEDESDDRDPFQELSKMFNGTELETVRKFGGRMHKEYVDNSDTESIAGGRPRLLLQDPSQELLDKQLENVPSEQLPMPVREKLNGRLEGIYQHYILVRPAPSLRILFTSPSLRVPGILQSPFLHRIGGSSRVRQDLASALAEGRGVTAKIRWLARADTDGQGDGRPRWIHCTPLIGHSGAVGVWMIVLVDDESSGASSRRFRNAPPVSTTIGGKEWDRRAHAASRDRKQLNSYMNSSERRSEAKSTRDGPNSRPASRATVNGRASALSNRLNDDADATPGAEPSEFSFQLR